MGSVTVSPNYLLTLSLAETIIFRRIEHGYAASLAGESFVQALLARKGVEGPGNC